MRRFFFDENSFKGRTWEEKLHQYLEKLAGDPQLAPWQVDQADQAIRLYFQNFYAAEKGPAKGMDNTASRDDPELFDSENALKYLKEWMRIKHYAYKTEQSYLNWCKRFFHYSRECRGGRPGDCVSVSPELIKDFLARLATHDKVAKSTQNQAFSALLFLCRHVLHIELNDMERNLRSKIGKKYCLCCLLWR